MGLFLSKISETLLTAYNFISVFKPCRILLLGLDGAGKTSILYKLKLKENVCTIPTIGFNVETVRPCKGLFFTVWDVGGGCKIQNLWHHYCRESDCVVLVIDSNDVERIDEAIEALHSLMQHDFMKNMPVMIMANKQDLPHALSTETILDKLQLLKVSKKWHVQPCCAISGDGLCESFLKMAELVKENRYH